MTILSRWTVRQIVSTSIVGVSEYGGETKKLDILPNAVKDAQAFHDILVKEFGYDERRIHLLVKPEETTRDNIEAALKRLLNEPDLGEKDSLLFFFSGHGLDHKGGYLAGIEADASDGPSVEKSCLEFDRIRRLLGEVRCSHKLVILDCCFSGRLFLETVPDVKDRPIARGEAAPPPGLQAEKLRGNGKLPVEPLREFLRSPAYFGLASGGFGPVSDGNAKLGHSPFMDSLLKNLKERTNTRFPAHTFTLEQLATRVKDDLAAIQGRQVPMWGRLSKDTGEFLFRPAQPDNRETPRERLHRELVERFVDGGLKSALDGDHEGALLVLLRGLELALQEKVPTDLESDYLRLVTALRQYPLVRRVWQANAPVRQAGFSPDGKHTYTLDAKNEVLVWAVDSDDPVSSPLPHPARVRRVLFSADGKRIVTGCDDGIIRLWNWDGEAVLLTIPHPGVEGIEIDPGGTRLISWAGQTARIWDARTGQPIAQSIDHGAAIRSVAISPDGRKFLTTGTNQAARLWTVDSGQAIGAPLQHEKAIDSAGFAPNGRFVLTNAGQALCNWSTDDASLAGKLNVLRPMARMRISTNGSYLMSLTGEGTCQVDQLVARIGPETQVHEFEILPNSILDDRSYDGRFTVLVRSGLAFLLDNITLDRPTVSFSATVPQSSNPVPLAAPVGNDRARRRRVIGKGSAPSFLRPVFTPNGGHLVSPGEGRYLRDVVTGTVEEWSTAPGVAERFPVAVSPHLTQALVAQEANMKTVRVVSFPDGRPLGAPFALPSPCVTAQLCHDMKGLMTIGQDGQAMFWEVPSGKPVGRPWAGDGVPPVNAVFGPDGRYAADTANGALRVWDVGAGQLVVNARPASDVTPVFTPDGRHLLIGRGKEAELVDAASQQVIGQPMQHDDNVVALAVSADGQLFATAAADRSIQLWHRPSGKPLSQRLRDEKGELVAVEFSADQKVIRLVFSRDSRFLAVVMDDRVAAVADLAANEFATISLRHRASIHWAAFSPASDRLVTASDDGQFRVWDLRLREVDRSLDALKMTVELVTASRLRRPDDPDSELKDLSADEILTRWRSATGKEYRQNHAREIARERSWLRDALVEAEELGEWTAGVTYCEHLIALEPRESRWRLALGTGRVALGRHAEAIKDLEFAARTDATSVKVWNQLGLAYSQSERLQDAVNAYTRAIELEPNNFVHWMNRGGVKRRLYNWGDAIADFTQAIALKPDANYVYLAELNVAVCRAELGEWVTAANLFERRASLSNRSSDYMQAALCWYAAKDIGKFNATRKLVYDSLPRQGPIPTAELASVAWLFALAPDGTADWKLPVPSDPTFIPGTPTEQQFTQRAIIRLFQLRQAQASGLMDRIKKASEIIVKEFGARFSNDDWEGLRAAVLANAYHALGERKKAAEGAASVKNWIDEREKSNRRPSWQHRFELNVLLQDIQK